MKRNQIVLGASAVVLTIASALAGKASMKLSAPALYYTGPGKSSCTTIQSSGIVSGMLTTGGSGNQAQLTTQGTGTTPMNLYADANCSKAVHFHG